MAVTGLWLSLRPLSLNGRRVITTILASNHKRFKISENASYSTANQTQFYFGTSDFSQIVKSPGFIDKTLLLKEVLQDELFILINAPRRFAKSTNMDMMKKFFQIEVDEAGEVINTEESPNRKIFKDNNLLVFQDQEFFHQHFATYPVIHITFKNVVTNSYAAILNGFRTALRDTYLEHQYLFESQIWSKYKLNINAFKRYHDKVECETLDEDKIVNGFRFLSECLYYHFGKKKVFVLIDEYDGPINKSIFENDMDIKCINSLLEDILSTTLKENKFVDRALLTGVSYFANVGLSGANNIEKYMFLGDHPFVKYYGLTDSEVDKLITKFKTDDETKHKVKSYYNGYTSKNNEKLYSLWSVLHYLRTKKLQSYWEKPGLVGGVSEALNFPLIQTIIQKLLMNESKKIKIFDNISLKNMIELKNIIHGRTHKEISDPDLFLNFLLQQGYLTYEGLENTIRIPNQEVHDVLTKELYTFYGTDLNRLFDECSAAFIEISVSDNKSFQKFVQAFQIVIDEVSPGIIKKNERVFHSILFSVLYRSRSRIFDDAELLETKKRPDLIIVQGQNGYIIEIKFKQDSKKTLEQIIDNKYYINFKSKDFKNVEHKVCLGVNVSEDLRVSVAVLVNSLDINEAVYFV